MNNKNKIVLIIIILLTFFLRFNKVDKNPPSLYWEEVALGYDAYSLLKTGKDHRGNPWPIVYLNSYMDFKPPLYVYTVIPSIWLFGLNEFGVRFPSAFFGSLTVLIIYFLAREVFSSFVLSKPTPGRSRLDERGYRELISLMVAGILAISPWHLQFSRAAFEANLALFIFSLAVLLFYKSLKNKIYLPFSGICFVLTLYTYHGARVFTPLFGGLLILIYWKKLWKMKSIALIALILGLIFSYPLIKEMNKVEVSQRFQETSAFTTLDPIIESNQKIKEDNYSLISRFIHHRFLEYTRIFLTNYAQYFNGNYLFLSGDGNPRHSTQEFGELYHWEFITLLIGFIYLFKNLRRKSSLMLVGWLLLTPIPGAITKTNPHCLRTILGLPAFIIISSIGLVWLISYFKNNKIILITVFCFLFSEFILYFHFYYVHYPILYSDQWQYGYKQAITYLKDHQREYDSFYLTDTYGRAYMYYLFFTQSDPVRVQNLIQPFKDKPNIGQLGNVYFDNQIPNIGRTLIISGPEEISQAHLLKTINFLDGKPAFKIWEK